MSLGLGIVLFVIGAILAFALNLTVDWIDLQLVGYILMAAGVIVIILGIILLAVVAVPWQPRTRASTRPLATGSHATSTRPRGPTVL